MSQYWPNFQQSGAGQHGPAPIQSKRVAFTGTGSTQTVNINWDSPYVDANYTVVYSIKMVTGNTPTDYGVVSQTASGIQVSVLMPSAGYQFEIHAVAFHD